MPKKTKRPIRIAKIKDRKKTDPALCCVMCKSEYFLRNRLTGSVICVKCGCEYKSSIEVGEKARECDEEVRDVYISPVNYLINENIID